MEQNELNENTGTSEDNTGATEQPKVKAPGVGDLAKDLIRAGYTNEEVLAAVKEKFPEAKTSMASINWYRNKLRGDGEEVPTARELKADAKADTKAAKEAEKAEKAAAKAAEKAEKAEAKAAEKAEKKRLADEAKATAKAKKEADAAAKAAGGDGEGSSDGKDPDFLG